MSINDAQSKAIAGIDLELRRGVLVLAVLHGLHGEEYGYSLKNALAEKGIDVEEGTLYPLLRRLESQGLLTSEWRVDSGRPRRYYRLSAAGRAAEATLDERWRDIVAAMDGILEKKEERNELE